MTPRRPAQLLSVRFLQGADRALLPPRVVPPELRARFAPPLFSRCANRKSHACPFDFTYDPAPPIAALRRTQPNALALPVNRNFPLRPGYLLIKGNPSLPIAPLPDVMDWTYTGNKLHPTQKSIDILTPLIDSFTQPGDLVLDPFSGSGSTCVAAQRTGRQYLGIELDINHHQTAITRLAGGQP